MEELKKFKIWNAFEDKFQEVVGYTVKISPYPELKLFTYTVLSGWYICDEVSGLSFGHICGTREDAFNQCISLINKHGIAHVLETIEEQKKQAEEKHAQATITAGTLTRTPMLGKRIEGL